MNETEDTKEPTSVTRNVSWAGATAAVLIVALLVACCISGLYITRTTNCG